MLTNSFVLNILIYKCIIPAKYLYQNNNNDRNQRLVFFLAIQPKVSYISYQYFFKNPCRNCTIQERIEQFRIYTLMKSNSEEMRELFLHTFSSSMITMQKLKEIIYINYSEDGSNDKKKEDTVYAFELFLQDCSGINNEVHVDWSVKKISSLWMP